VSRRLPFDRVFALTVLILIAIGLVMIFSASSIVSRERHDSSSVIFVRQLIFVGISLPVLFLFAAIDYKWYKHRAVVYCLMFLTTVLLIVPLLRPANHGVKRWIAIGPVNFQPSELAKLAIIIFTAYYLTERRKESHLSLKELIPYLVVLGVITVLILAEPDFGTAACVAGTGALLLFLGGLRYRFLLGGLLFALPAVYLLIVNVPYRRSRLLSFLNPSDDPFGAGYHIRQSLIAVGSGGLTGQGYAEGQQKLFYLPEPHTDFIFAVIGEEIGLVGCLLVLGLFALLFWRGVRISLRANTVFGSYLGLGIVGMLGLQALINMSVVVRLLPTKGIPLPFISVGGSSMMVLLAAVGIVLNLSKQGQLTGDEDWTEDEPAERLGVGNAA
jgi:cell division protein FtsW